MDKNCITFKFPLVTYPLGVNLKHKIILLIQLDASTRKNAFHVL